MKNVLILEDKQSHREALFKILSEEHVKIFAVSEIPAAYEILMKYQIHLFLLDIILQPEKSGDVLGLKFACQLREIKKYKFTPIIFVTSLEDPRLYSYRKLHCFGYVEKPFCSEKVKKMVREALEYPVLEDEERMIYFRKDGIIYAKSIKEIVYIESSRRKVTIYCKDDILEISYKTCSEILEELDATCFIQCSRFGIVNKKFIQEIDYRNRYIKLKHMEKLVEIGTVMKSAFRQQMENK